MEAESTEPRAAEIQSRVEAWVGNAISTAETTAKVTAEAAARPAISLPAAPGETVPEEWTVAVRLRFSGADEAEARRLLGTVSGATAAVTLESREAAEITWPDTADATLAPSGDEGDLETEHAVGFAIPWPHEGDAAVPAI